MKYINTPALLKGSSHVLPSMHVTQYPGAYFLSNSCCQTTGKYISRNMHLCMHYFVMQHCYMQLTHLGVWPAVHATVSITLLELRKEG